MTEGIDTDPKSIEADQRPDSELPVREIEPGTDPVEALETAVAVGEENWAKYLRVTAELENFRKRAARDVENARKYGIEQFARELLGVIDSLEMGLEAGANATVESLLEGKTATLKLLRSAIEKSGVELIDPEGEPFDPQLHEAITMQPSETAEPGSVLAVIQKGYQLNGRLLRPARVVVAGEPG
jgi:molecular chaperone GrpE